MERVERSKYLFRRGTRYEKRRSEIGRYTAQVLTHTTALSHSVGPKALLAFKRGMLPHSVTHAREGPLRTP